MIRSLSFFLVAVLLGACAVPGSAASAIQGRWALQEGTPRVQGELLAQPLASDPLGRRLSIWMTRPGSAEPLRNYEVHATKLLHLIVVSDDFRQFLHVHPMLGSDGRFTITQHFLTPGLYHLYADSMPEGMGNQVVRFDLAIGAEKPASKRVLPTGGTISTVGTYTVTLDGTKVKASSQAALRFHFSESGKPAHDLRPYLGELFHAIILNVQDETYVHAHPMPLHADETMRMGNMEGMVMSSPPDMLLHLRIARPGAYKMWIQFHAGGTLHVAEFALTAT